MGALQGTLLVFFGCFTALKRRLSVVSRKQSIYGTVGIYGYSCSSGKQPFFYGDLCFTGGHGAMRCMRSKNLRDEKLLTVFSGFLQIFFYSVGLKAWWVGSLVG